MNIEEQIHFTQRLSFLVKAGIPLLDSLHMLRSGTVKKSTMRLLDRLIHDISNGQSLSMSLSHGKGVFVEFVVHMINVGEISGTLSENLVYVSIELKKRHALKRKIRGALLYPLFITVATVGITALLMFYIFPKILPIFKSMHVVLPLSTRILLFVDYFVGTYWPFLLVVLFSVPISCVLVYRKFQKVKYVVHFLLLHSPLVKNISRSLALANFSRTLGLLLKSGIPIIAALEINAKTSGNLLYQQKFSDLAVSVSKGDSISIALADEKKLFPSIVTQMVAVGERTGGLSESLLYLSDLYEAEVDEFAKNISTSVEPILMVCMGLVVGFVAVSIIAPIYEITQNLHQ